MDQKDELPLKLSYVNQPLISCALTRFLVEIDISDLKITFSIFINQKYYPLNTLKFKGFKDLKD